ncbi:MAG: O-methyltransferase [Tannerellaceae bacterium]|jgi:predicted O-methyltransferase YrrM|nr:O-methyltransferase [Tannerellaceae bacterium]
MTDYILDHIDPETELLKELSREAHVKLLRPRMMAGHLQGRILKMFCRILRPKLILEIGTYTGYATICLAEGTDSDAVIHTVEIDDEMESFMMKYISRAPGRDKIRVHFGNAMEVVPKLQTGPFDMIFIDADKHRYPDYYDMAFPVLRSGGLILADNTLWDGKLLSGATDKRTSGIAIFNEKIRQDDRVEKVILPLRDGLTVIWKK